MTGETIERVAKAIAKVRECEPTAEQVASCIWGHDNVEGYSCICRMAARAAIAALPPLWQPISTAPRDGTPILIWVCGRFHEAVWEGEYGDNWERSEIDGAWQIRWAEINSYGVTPDEPPTHWAPRPEPPPGLSYED